MESLTVADIEIRALRHFARHFTVNEEYSGAEVLEMIDAEIRMLQEVSTGGAG